MESESVMSENLRRNYSVPVSNLLNLYIVYLCVSIVRKILGNFLSDEVRTDQSGLHLELFLHNYSFGQDGVKRIEKRNGIIRKIRINEEESKTEENKQRSKACL